MRGGLARLVALVALVAALARSPVAAETGSPAPAAPTGLEDAALRLAKIASPPEYAAALGAFSSALAPSDSLVLLNRFLPSTGADYRKPLLVKAGDLALLLGLFVDAAARYEEAASLGGKDSGLLLRAARCHLAAGDPDKAAALSSDLVLGAQDPALAAAARLVGAWSLLLRGRGPDARVAAASVIASGDAAADAARAGQRREARFLLWLSSEAPEKAAAAAALAGEFPGSPEALIASGAASPPPLPHWYLGGLTAASPSATSPSATTAKAPPPAPVVAEPAGAAVKPAPADVAKGRRLQVGYFSLEENARALRDELASKKIQATIETRMRAVKAGATEERRWIVVVDGGKDLAKAMQTLKDAGYESYVIE